MSDETTAETSPETAADAPETTTTEPAEWAKGIEDEDLRTAAGRFESPEKLLDSIGYKAPDWRQGLPEDLEPIAKRFNSREDVLRSVQTFQKREGQVRVPNKDATEDDWTAYHKAIGVPEKPEGYEFPAVKEETDEIKADRAQWSERFHKLNVPQDTAKELMRMVGEDMQAAGKAQQEADNAFHKASEDALKDEWKSDYEKNLSIAKNAATAFAEKVGIDFDDLRNIEMGNGRFLLDKPEIVRIFAAVGREMQEGNLGPSLSEGERDNIDTQIREVRDKIEDAQGRGDRKLANKLYQKEQDLIAKRDGSTPIVGSQGRAA